MAKVTVANYPMLTHVPIVLVGAYVDGAANFATVGAFGVVCTSPVLYASLHHLHHTTAGVRENGFFSVNVPSPELVRETDYCGIVTGRKVDKSQVFRTFDDSLGTAPMIEECQLNILCRVFDSKPIEGFEMFFGEIVATYLDESCLTDGSPDPQKIEPLIGIGATYFARGKKVGEAYRAGRALIAERPES
jgi:flavin reductase (DIM6/NTAB) family NADH-FMN oxidoreductase RutF